MRDAVLSALKLSILAGIPDRDDYRLYLQALFRSYTVYVPPDWNHGHRIQDYAERQYWQQWERLTDNFLILKLECIQEAVELCANQWDERHEEPIAGPAEVLNFIKRVLGRL